MKGSGNINIVIDIFIVYFPPTGYLPNGKVVNGHVDGVAVIQSANRPPDLPPTTLAIKTIGDLTEIIVKDEF